VNKKHKVDECLNRVRDKLPKEVCLWTDEHCKFIYVEPCSQVSDELYIGKAEYIVNVYKRACTLTTDFLEASIAHEVAHCWLGHKSNYHIKVKEQEADNLAITWGFNVKGLNEYLKTHRV